MDSRAQFEAWCTRNGGYLHGLMRLVAWEVWQASRAAIEIELPGKISSINATDIGFVLPEAASYDEALDDCGDALAIAGVKYSFGAKPDDELPLQHEAKEG